MSVNFRLQHIAGACLAVCTLAAQAAGPNVPANLGSGLRQLVANHLASPATPAAQLAGARHVAIDERGRVLVEVHLDGRAALDTVAARVRALDADVRHVDVEWRRGVVSAYVPLSRMTELAALNGVSHAAMIHRPRTNVGATTAQSAAVLNSDDVNAGGITGAGVTVGILSDTYNVAQSSSRKAAQDVSTGDLPNLTNPNANSPGVKFLIEAPGIIYRLIGTDEGRGMAQIVHDIAPGADLCFATANDTPTIFANNIRSLRTNPACNADVIVDDIIYLAEPMFSDGPIAKAVDDVAFSTTLAGKRVSYFSSAGNRGNGYTDRFRRVSPAQAANIDVTDTSIDLSTVPATIDTSGGFQDFDAGSAVDISQAVTCSGDDCTIVFQWNDPFDVPGGITSDYNLLVFNAAGQFQSALSLTTDNFGSVQPLEISGTDLVANQSYTFVIARTGAGTGTANVMKYVFFGGSLIAQYNTGTGNNASTYGHNSANGANGVAAYVYDDLPVSTPPFDAFTPSIEGFSSPGPALIYFDAAGNRLTRPQNRQRPNIAAPDGVNTTFFPPGALSGTDYEGDGFPNFFGTSAAAPAAAAVAALMIQKAGGPGTITPESVRTKLQQSAPARDIDPTVSSILDTTTLVRFTASGTASNDPNFFKIELARTGLRLDSLTVNATPAGIQFDPSPTTGFPLTVGTTTGPTITSALPTTTTQVLNFTFSGFTSGNTLSFGIDRDVAALAAYGNSADALAGTTVTYTVTNVSTGQSRTETKTLANRVGTGYNLRDGFGLIDAVNAVNNTP